MPTTSDIADKLADDLVIVGKILGFESTKEAPVVEGSPYCVDVLWKLRLPMKTPFLINVASIEIQYSNSPTSIGHNIWKAELPLHPGAHIVISYNELTEHFKELARLHYPHAGLVIFEGQEGIKELNTWISGIIQEEDEDRRAEIRKRFFRFLNPPEEVIVEQREKKKFELWQSGLFEPVVFEITVKSSFAEGSGESGDFAYTSYVTGSAEEAKITALKKFEKEMNDVPFEWEGKHVSLKGLQITCYQLFGEARSEKITEDKDAVYLVAVSTSVGGEEIHFEITRTDIGPDPEKIEKRIKEELTSGIEQMQRVPHEILKQNVFVMKYSKLRSWKENAEGEVLLLSKINLSKEEQKEKLKTFFSKEFDFNVGDLLQLDEIDSRARYFENLEYVKSRLRELLKEDREAFRYRMHEDELRELEKFLGIMW